MVLPKLREIPLETDFQLRAPHEHMERIAYRYRRYFEFLNSHRYIENYEKASLDDEKPEHAAETLETVLRILRNQIIALHGLGHPIEAIQNRLQEKMVFEKLLIERHPRKHPWGVNLNYLHSEIYTIALLTLSAEELDGFVFTPLFDNTKDKDRVYVLDVLMSSFRPDFKTARKYTRDKFSRVWTDPLHKALTHDKSTKEEALAQLMEVWVDRVAQFFPLDWEPWEKQQYIYVSEDGDKRYAQPNFCFAYEVSLAVCAYDLDDSSFRNHPYYPRDLVDYYRKNIRNTRDAWRKAGQGPTLTLELFKPERINLTKKKNKGFRRWLDIASNGDSDAVSEVVLRFPNIRKIKNLTETVAAMGDYGIALTVDLKDDETCEYELNRLISERNIQAQYTAPETKYARGSGRCLELLEHSEAWLAEHGYRLIQLTQDGDWDAIVIEQIWEEEFADLSKKLGLNS